MRTFVVSDLHGQGKVYNSIIKYLSSIDDDIKLYINGDVIDKGEDSIEILLDIINRDNIDIEMLAGNHELFLYKYLNMYNFDRSWFLGGNGGRVTANKYDSLNDNDKIKIKNYLDDIYISKKLPKIGKYEGITISHASPLKDFNDYDIRLKDCFNNYNYKIFNALWFRDSMDKMDYGIDKYLNIIGHTPVIEYGKTCYRQKNNILNIDGGCAVMDIYPDTIECPLVEIDYDNNRLDIISFNKEGEFVNNYNINLSRSKEKILEKK